MAKKMTDAQKAKLKQQLMKGGNLDKPAKPGTRKITVTAKSTPVKKPSNKTVQAGSMAGNSKLVLDNAAKAKAAKTYSPKPMSASDKRAAGFRGATTQYQINLRKKEAAAKTKPKSLASKVTSAAGSVAKRAKTVAREVRDIPTALGTVARATAAGKPKAGTNTPPNKQASYAKYDLKKQLKQVGDAVKSGKKGTPAVRYGKNRPN